MTSILLPFPTRDETPAETLIGHEHLDLGGKYMVLRLAGHPRPEIYAHLGISDAPALRAEQRQEQVM